MPQPADDDDATVKLTHPAAAAPAPSTSGVPGSKSGRPPIWAFVVPSVLLIGVAASWIVWTRSPEQPPSRAAPPPAASPAVEPKPKAPPVSAAPETAAAPAPTAPGRTADERYDFRIETANEQRILNHVPNETAPALKVFRFAANPRILVLDFKSLREQGRMLNRAAAFVEKAGLPRDRLLEDAELEAAVGASGDTVETFYYGHDYSVGSIVRFFALADRDNLRLSREENTLRDLVRQEGWFDPDSRAGLISIPQVGADEHVTWEARATILHHELSHGEYFTNPDYAGFVHRFWTQTLTTAERDRLREYLRSEGYDAGLDEVMENEAQAYLMFTDSREFFSPDLIGMSRSRLNELRIGFYRSMPAGWLRDNLGQTLNGHRTAPPPRP